MLNAIPTATSEEVDNLATALAHDKESARQDLEEAAKAATRKRDWKHKTRLGTVALHLGDTTIRVEQDFWISDREVAAGLFLEFLKDEYADRLASMDEIKRDNQGAPSLPVVNVSWYDAVMFCNWLSLREGRDPCYRKEGKESIRDYDTKMREYDAWMLIAGASGFRLPTDDEWEYACRARTTTLFSFGDDEEMLDRYAVFVKNADNGPDGVGGRLCNAWGLFDMHGNAWEWCQQWYTEGSRRVFRSGAWNNLATSCRSAIRFRGVPSIGSNALGLRVATVVSGQSAG